MIDKETDRQAGRQTDRQTFEQAACARKKKEKLKIMPCNEMQTDARTDRQKSEIKKHKKRNTLRMNE